MVIDQNKIIKFGLVLVIFFAFCLRLYRLGSYPPLNADEAAIGYNAWSLLETGRDEHGHSWPIHFQSFGDYKPGGYFYLVLPLVKLFGLNEWAVRLPSALAGVATVYLVYQLALLLWQDKKLGLIWAAVLAFSPWHLHFSRGGWESNFALFLITLGVFLFYRWVKKKEFRHQLSGWSAVWVVLPFVLAMYFYHSARVVAPVIGGGLVLLNFKRIWPEKIKWLVSGGIAVILLLPLVFSLFRGGASSRFAGVGLLADSGPLWRANELRVHHKDPEAVVPTLFHNRYLSYGLSFFQKYFSHFNGQFLFIVGDDVPRSKLPDMGVLYLFEVGWLALGTVWWLRQRKDNWFFIFFWLLAAPLASAMTFQAPSALRSLPLIIPLTFFIAVGIKGVLAIKLKWKKLVVLVLLLGYLWSFISWQDQYFTHYLRRFPFAWPGGFSQLGDWLGQNRGEQRVIITDKYDQPYILMLFYLGYPPARIQNEIELTPPDEYGFSTVRRFGPYCFGIDDCSGWLGKDGGLIVAADEPVDGTILKEIWTAEGNLSFTIRQK